MVAAIICSSRNPPSSPSPSSSSSSFITASIVSGRRSTRSSRSSSNRRRMRVQQQPFLGLREQHHTTVVLLLGLLLLLLIGVSNAILHVPMKNATSYRSMPAMYYGKPWHPDQYIPMRLQYLGGNGGNGGGSFDIDWCQEADSLFHSDGISTYTTRNPIIVPQDGLPVAILINDALRSDEKGHYPCHLIDYEHVAMKWNISYILFYDAIPNRPLRYIWTYLDDRIMSDTNSIGFQLLSHQTGNELISMIQEQNRIDPKQGGLYIQLDGKPSTLPGPRYPIGQVIRRQAVHIIPKFTGLLSLLGSSYIIYHCIGTVTGRNRLVVGKGFDRLLVALSIADIISSTAYIFSHWMFPQEPQIGADPGWYNVIFPFSTGTKATCTIQGFLIQVGQLASVFFTAFISIQTVLQIRYRWTKHDIQTKVEKYWFGIGTIIPIITGIVAVSIGAMNPTTGGICFINSNPNFCRFSYQGWCATHKIWGSHLFIWNLVITGTIVTGLLTVMGSMILLYVTARSQELQAAQWSMTASEGRAQKAVVKTASLYLGAYVFIYVGAILALLMRHGGEVATAVVLPIQGFLNAMIYSKQYQTITKHLTLICGGSSCWGGTKGSSVSGSGRGGGSGPVPKAAPATTAAPKEEKPASATATRGRRPGGGSSASIAISTSKRMPAIIESSEQFSETEQESGNTHP